MNHRELLLSAQKKPRFSFLALPAELQDEIVDGLDSGMLSLREASEMVKAHGKSLSHEAIAGYHRAVRRERRLYESRCNLSQVIAGFAGQPPEESIKGLLGWIMASAATGLAEGTIRIGEINLARILGLFSGVTQARKDDAADEKVSSLGPEETRKLVEEVERALGVRQ